MPMAVLAVLYVSDAEFFSIFQKLESDGKRAHNQYRLVRVPNVVFGDNQFNQGFSQTGVKEIGKPPAPDGKFCDVALVRKHRVRYPKRCYAAVLNAMPLLRNKSGIAD